MLPYSILSKRKKVWTNCDCINPITWFTCITDDSTLNVLLESIKTAQTIKGDPFSLTSFISIEVVCIYI